MWGGDNGATMHSIQVVEVQLTRVLVSLQDLPSSADQKARQMMAEVKQLGGQLQDIATSLRE